MLAALSVLAACSDPSLEGTSFRCDADHACPTDQTCLFGRCRRHPAADIGCGDSTCNGTQQCCVDNANGPRCIAAGEICPGDHAAVCDGLDDCGTDEHCCNANTTACGLTCEDYACSTDDDCPETVPHCCPQAIVPWGQCSLSPC